MNNIELKKKFILNERKISVFVIFDNNCQQVESYYINNIL